MRTRLFTALAVACLAFATGGGALAQESVKLKVTLFTPATAPQNVLLRKIDERLRAESDDRLSLELFESSQMGPATRQFDLVRTGVADMSYVLLGVSPGRFPMTQILELPGLADSGITGESVRKVSSAALELSEQYLADEFSGTKLLNLTLIPNPVLFTKNKVETLQEIAGLRIRHPSANHAELLKAMDAVPALISPLEISEALSRGQVDGALTAYSAIAAWQLQDTIKHALEFDTGGTAFALVINEGTLNAMPQDLREIFDRHFGAANQQEWGLFSGNDEAALRTKFTGSGIEARSFSAEDRAAYAEIADRVREETLVTMDASGHAATAFYNDLVATMARQN